PVATPARATPVPAGAGGLVTGKVTGASGAPVVGALVAVRSAGKVQQLTTDAKGEFRATVEGADVDVAVSAIGYTTQTLKSRITPGKTATVNVKLFRPGKAPR
ncbi:MAG TPA: carboxypeptidase-like regulatory domain-containing protein, partial [bacterium]|nr:carboxypeptidase-like regulatory domain-containing protein [bacterium]